MNKSLFEFSELTVPAQFPVGSQVWIGDPCYVLEPWDKFCDLSSYEPSESWIQLKKQLDTAHELIHDITDPKFYPMAYWSTAYGDGCYPLYCNGNNIGECGVDAGMLSIIPLEALSNISRDELNRYGVIIDVPDAKFRVIVTNGDLRWGPLELYSSDNDPYANCEEDD